MTKKRAVKKKSKSKFKKYSVRKPIVKKKSKKVSQGKRIKRVALEKQLEELTKKIKKLERAEDKERQSIVNEINTKLSNVEISDIAKETYKELGKKLTNLLTDMRDTALGEGAMALHGSNSVDWSVLKEMIIQSHRRYRVFEKVATEMGLSEQQIRTVWFSPKARTRF